ncbi:MAG TPA: hypothetical protein VKM93_19770 [Terriglobia bacterium]|nr:hypothetical protein [Terriglobia bacterium]
MNQESGAEKLDSSLLGLFDFRQDWAEMQPFFARVSRLPADTEAFTLRYGTFLDDRGVQDFVGALRQVNEIAGSLGGPATLKQRIGEDPNYLFAAEPPGEIYAHLVWLASQIANGASTFSGTLPRVRDLQSTAVPPQERARSVRRILVGDGGLVSTATGMRSKIQRLRERLVPLVPRLTAVIQTFNQTKLVNQANETIGALQGEIKRLQKQADEADEAAKGWFGKDKAKKESETFSKKIETDSAELRRKTVFAEDLRDFSITANRVVPALMNTDDRLRKTEKVFADAAERLTSVCTLASDEQLSNYDWLAGAADFPTALSKWNGVEGAAHEFVQGSMVSL